MPVHVTPVHPAQRTSVLAGRSHTRRPAMTVDSEPIAVDLGSAQLRIWLGQGGMLSVPFGEGLRRPLMRRGRIVDGAACVAEVRRLLRDHRLPVPVGALVVACRPVLATRADQDATRQVLTAVLAPSRLLFVDTVRAGAIGAGAAAGTLLLADVGAQLSEVAVLENGRVVAARRAEVGTRDLSSVVTVAMLADTVARLVRELRREPAVRPLATAALARGVIVVGDGATRPDLTTRLAAAVGAAVHCAASPRTAALTGASLAATAASRHPAGT
ncbi:cell shape-determining protein MreB [Micromonospora craterilacus]|uniref:Cell shape-determining protein MreB n=1 Tax=Micromonospora craterilacus TaxID=1655439 RepID=A0A2W2EAT7_9ACTN|nr:rod shape-determining protein [Micromonospora craterilacus]PZG13879.1 cell shape-determining protein MreB [Micromonospora craterilacus]